MQDYKDFIAEILIDERTLQNRIKELAEEINRAAQKDVLGRNCLCKPWAMDLPDYEQLRTFGGEQ